MKKQIERGSKESESNNQVKTSLALIFITHFGGSFYSTGSFVKYSIVPGNEREVKSV